jgi:hypothetical protein
MKNFHASKHLLKFNSNKSTSILLKSSTSTAKAKLNFFYFFTGPDKNTVSQT